MFTEPKIFIFEIVWLTNLICLLLAHPWNLYINLFNAKFWQSLESYILKNKLPLQYKLVPVHTITKTS